MSNNLFYWLFLSFYFSETIILTPDCVHLLLKWSQHVEKTNRNSKHRPVETERNRNQPSRSWSRDREQRWQWHSLIILIYWWFYIYTDMTHLCLELPFLIVIHDQPKWKCFYFAMVIFITFKWKFKQLN